MGFRFVCQIFVESDDGIQLATEFLIFFMVVPIQRCVDIIAGGLCTEVDAHVLPVVHELQNADLTVQGVSRRVDFDVCILIPGIVIGKRGQVAR